MRTISIPWVCGLVLCGCHTAREEAPEKPVVAVKVARAETADLPQVINAPATVYARQQANIAARVTAPIRELRVRKGDTVRAGQVLAVLESRDVAAQRQEAQAAVEDAQATLQKTVGGTVPTDVERARGQLQTSRAALDQAQKNYDRRRQLFDQGAISQRDLLQSQTDFATAQTNHDVAKRALDLLEHQSGGQDIAIAKARVEEARARLSAASASLQYTELRSPFAGIVTEQFQYPGDMGGPGTPIYTVMDLSSVTARAQVPEGSAASVHTGQACNFTGADNSITGVRGKVSVVNGAVDSARRTVEVWCEISRPPTSLRAGVFGSVAIEIAAVTGAVIVPAAAIQINEGSDTGIAFVVDEKQVAHKRDVVVGVRSQDRLQVKSGVKPGEMLVTEGGYSLPDGAQVRLPGDKEQEAKP